MHEGPSMHAVLAAGSILEDVGFHLVDVPDIIVHYMKKGGKLDCEGSLAYTYDSAAMTLTLHNVPPELDALRDVPLALEAAATRTLGGAAYTCSYGAAQYGESAAAMAGIHAEDKAGRLVRETLSAAGIGTGFLLGKAGGTGTSLILRASVRHPIKAIRGQRLIITSRGAACLRPEDIPEGLFAGGAPKLAAVSNLGDFDTTRHLLARISETDASFAYLIGGGDIQRMNAGAVLPEGLYKGRAYAGASLNRDEWRRLTPAARRMLRDTLGVISISDGARASILWSREAGQGFRFPAEPPPSPVVDTTGAGDTLAFTLAFARAVWGLSLRESAKLAAMVAARTICHTDSISGFPKLSSAGEARAFISAPPPGGQLP